jgi:hypothetical protein
MQQNPTTPAPADEDINFGHKTHYDEAAQSLLYLNALLTVLSLAGHEGLSHYSPERLSVSLNGIARLAYILSVKALAELDGMQYAGAGGEKGGATNTEVEK